MDFKQAVLDAANKFKQELNLNEQVIGIISHNDADGVTSASIIAETLSRLGLKFHLMFVTRIDSDLITKIKNKKYKIFMLLDYGSNEVEEFSLACPEKKFYVLDHHISSAHKEEFKDKIIDINPMLFGVDGATEISAAGVCYLFSKAVDERNKDLSFLAILGAKGDMQSKSGSFTGLNLEILSDATSMGLIEIKKGLNVYGWTSRPIHKALEYSINPYIPGISGSESGTVQFLQELGISLKKEDGSWKTINDLSEDDHKKLATGIIIRRHKEKEAGNIFAEKMFLPNFKIKELSEADVLTAWINSCGKLDKCSLGLGVALGDKNCYEESKKYTDQSKKELVKIMQYFYDNENNKEVVLKTNNAIYFLCKDKFNNELISTSSTLLSTNLDEEGLLLICFSNTEDKTRVSGRIIGNENPKDINVGSLLSSVSKELGGEGGGHKPAAGATIPKGKEESFINLIENELQRVSN